MSGLVALFNSAKGNVFMLAVGALFLAHEVAGVPLSGWMFVALGGAFMFSRSLVECAAALRGKEQP